MHTIFVRHKTRGIRGIVVGYSTETVSINNELRYQPLIGVTWLNEEDKYPAVQTIAPDEIEVDEVIDEVGNRIDEYKDDPNDDTQEDEAVVAPVEELPHE